MIDRRNKMNTIYEHNISQDEINQLSRMIPGRIIDRKKEYLYELDNDLRYADLYRLYLIRGEKEAAQKYYGKIEDEILRHFLHV